MAYQGLDLSYKNIIIISFTVGLGFSDKKISNYYYEVNSKDVNATRREYHSKSGYSGLYNTFSITKMDEHFWYGGFSKHYYLDNVVFEKSPLVETKNSLLCRFAFSYIF